MTDDELRALVREAISRHLGHAVERGQPAVRHGGDPAWRAHPSFGQFLAVHNDQSACVIEPAVQCDHCGFCKSYGH